MLSVMTVAALAMAMQDPGQWQDFGAGSDGARISLNLDSVESGADGPEAMVRLRYARPQGDGAAQADFRAVFNCTSRMVTRLRMGELDARGQIISRDDNGERMPAVRAAAGTPMGEVLDLVCSMANG